MARHIDRLRAEQDLRSLNVALCATVSAQGDKEFLPALQSALREEMGLVTQFQEVISEKSDILKFMELGGKG